MAENKEESYELLVEKLDAAYGSPYWAVDFTAEKDDQNELIVDLSRAKTLYCKIDAGRRCSITFYLSRANMESGNALFIDTEYPDPKMFRLFTALIRAAGTRIDII